MILLQGLFRLVLPLSLTGSLAVLLVLGAKAVTRDRLGPGWNYYIWALPMALYLIPVPFSLNWGWGSLAESGRSSELAEAAGAAITAAHGATGGAAAISAGNLGLWRQLLPVLAWVWLFGVFFTAAVRVAGRRSLAMSLQRCSRPGSPESRLSEVFREVKKELQIPEDRVALVICPGVESPMIAGLWHPAVILPREDYPREQLRMILRHELCHYRGRDLWVKAVVTGVACLHWFNPLVWVMARDLDRCCELRCDQRTAGGMGTGERRLYGRMLLDIAQEGAAPAGLPLTGGKEELKRRLALLREGWNISRWERATSLGIALTVAVTGVVCAASVYPGPVLTGALEGEKPSESAAAGEEAPPLWSGEEAAPPEHDGETEPPVQPPLQMQAVLADEVTGQQAPPEETPEKAAPADTEAAPGDKGGPADTEAAPGDKSGPADTEAAPGDKGGPADTETAPENSAEPGSGESTPAEPSDDDLNRRFEEIQEQAEYRLSEEEQAALCWNGRLLWPVDGGEISCGFGGYYGHQGTDIRADTGTEIYAAADGMVVYSVGYSIWPYGKRVDIDHGDGVVTRYAHCSKVLVAPGEKVRAGQLIALVGRTGNATGSHCHFEVRLDGVPQNPMDYVE